LGQEALGLAGLLLVEALVGPQQTQIHSKVLLQKIHERLLNTTFITLAQSNKS
jgi:hypothetical protein